jgi:hypothetical protein
VRHVEQCHGPFIVPVSGLVCENVCKHSHWRYSFRLRVCSRRAAADAVAFWNEVGVTASAIHAGRAAAVTPVDLAYVHAAIYDVVVALRGGYRPFAVTVDTVPAGASVDAAIASAAHRVLLTLFPSDHVYLDDRYSAALNGIADGQPKTDGIGLGEQVASQLLASRTGDGWNAAVVYVPGSGRGVWQPTAPTAPIAPWLGLMRPFAFNTASQFRAEPPPSLDSHQWAEDYAEVQQVGSFTSATRTPAQTETARFYGEHAGIQYARIFRAFADERGCLSLSRAQCGGDRLTQLSTPLLPGLKRRDHSRASIRSTSTASGVRSLRFVPVIADGNPDTIGDSPGHLC